MKNRWFKVLKIRPETVKFLKENIAGALFDINWSRFFFFFLNLSPDAKEIKAKVNKWSLIKLTNFCPAKESIDKNEKTTY